jgi:flagellar motor switch protein FliG
MKNIDEMSGTEKAAAFLVAMGQDAASEVLRYLDEESVFRISHEIAKIDSMSATEREDLVGEFFVSLKKLKGSSPAGKDIARKILSEAFGRERADEVLSKVSLQLEDNFEFLKEAHPEAISDMVVNEHPQIIAVMIAKMDSAQAGAVMKLLPRDTKKDVALRLARMGKIAPEAVMQASFALRKKFDQYKANEATGAPGGVNAIAGILNHLGGDDEKRIMDHFNTEMPEFADEVRKKVTIFEFEAIASLTNREIRLVLGRVAENRVIARALKGSDDDLRYRVLRNMSSNRADDVISLMDLMGPLRLSDVTEARTHIVSIMKDLNAKGVILIRKSGEDLVE